MALTVEKLSKMIDHTLLKIDCTYKEIENICSDAINYNFASVAVNPSNIALSKEILKGSSVKICTAIGFYLGSYPSDIKKYEITDAVEKGADELDMLINISALKEKKYDVITEEVKSLVSLANGKVTKVILETCYLDNDEIIIACKIARDNKADFVKTSTGFGTHGAMVEHVKLMRKTVGEDMGVKAAGGISSVEYALELIKAGANRIGTSSSVKIIESFISNRKKTDI